MSTAEILTITYETGGRQVFNTQAVTSQQSTQPQVPMVYDKKKGKATVNGVALDKQKLGTYFSADDLKLYNSGSTMYTAGTLLCYIGGFPFGYYVGYSLGSGGMEDSGISKKLMIGSGVVLVSGIVVGLIGEKKMKQAVNNYNQSSSLAFQPQINLFSATGHDISLGLTLTF
jgi:hypothetical protein